MPGEAVPIGLLTGSTPGRRRADLLGKLGSGELSLIVGTHAVIEEPVRFAALGVAVVDGLSTSAPGSIRWMISAASTDIWASWSTSPAQK